jgi:hypothetical protein
MAENGEMDGCFEGVLLDEDDMAEPGSIVSEPSSVRFPRTRNIPIIKATKTKKPRAENAATTPDETDD